MSIRIIGWLVGDCDGKKSDLKKNLNKKNIIWIKSENEESCIFAKNALGENQSVFNPLGTKI